MYLLDFAGKLQADRGRAFSLRSIDRVRNGQGCREQSEGHIC